MGIVHDSRYVECTEAFAEERFPEFGPILVLLISLGIWFLTTWAKEYGGVQLCQAARQKNRKEWIMLWRLAIRNAKVSWPSSGKPEMANSNTLYVNPGINIS